MAHPNLPLPMEENTQRDAVHLQAGRALHQAHRFERNLKGLAALVHSIHNAGTIETEFSFSRLSIGPLLDAIRRLIDFDPSLPLVLESARNRRNALCHSYFEDHQADLETVDGRQRMVEDLQESEALFEDAADFCSGALGLLIAHLEDSLDGQ